jgi:hypothetical protein
MEHDPRARYEGFRVGAIGAIGLASTRLGIIDIEGAAYLFLSYAGHLGAFIAVMKAFAEGS